MDIEKTAGVGFALWMFFIVLVNMAWMSFLGWVIYVVLVHFKVI